MIEPNSALYNQLATNRNIKKKEPPVHSAHDKGDSFESSRKSTKKKKTLKIVAGLAALALIGLAVLKRKSIAKLFKNGADDASKGADSPQPPKDDVPSGPPEPPKSSDGNEADDIVTSTNGSEKLPSSKQSTVQTVEDLFSKGLQRDGSYRLNDNYDDLVSIIYAKFNFGEDIIQGRKNPFAEFDIKNLPQLSQKEFNQVFDNLLKRYLGESMIKYQQSLKSDDGILYEFYNQTRHAFPPYTGNIPPEIFRNRSSKVSDIKIHSPQDDSAGLWIYHTPNTLPEKRHSTHRMSMNVRLNEDLLNELDEYLIKQGVLAEFKHAPSEWSVKRRHDTITMYFFGDVNMEHIESLSKIADKYIRGDGADKLIGRKINGSSACTWDYEPKNVDTLNFCQIVNYMCNDAFKNKIGVSVFNPSNGILWPESTGTIEAKKRFLREFIEEAKQIYPERFPQMS